MSCPCGVRKLGLARIPVSGPGLGCPPPPVEWAGHPQQGRRVRERSPRIHPCRTRRAVQPQGEPSISGCVPCGTQIRSGIERARLKRELASGRARIDKIITSFDFHSEKAFYPSIAPKNRGRALLRSLRTGNRVGSRGVPVCRTNSAAYRIPPICRKIDECTPCARGSGIPALWAGMNASSVLPIA